MFGRSASVGRQLGFVLGGCTVSYGGMALLDTHERVRLFQQSTFSSRGTWIFPAWSDVKEWFDSVAVFGRSYGGSRQTVDAELRRTVAQIRQWPTPKLFNDYAEMMFTRWRAQSENQRWTSYMILANTIVFGAWRILPERWMLRHFSDQALSPRSYTMLTSTFSHRDLWHLGMNMVALNSFAPPLMEIMGRYEFIAFYCSSGMLASFASNFWRRQQALLDQSSGGPSASLGASGAIFSLVSAYTMHHPDTKLHLIFLPTVALQASTALAGLIAFDLACALRGASILDHYAHLGGAFTGLAYVHFDGTNNIWLPAQREAYHFWKRWKSDSAL